MTRHLFPVIAASLLASCGDEPAPVQTDGDARNATGDVLESSISDEMLPLDRLESTSPPAEPADEEGGEAAGSDAGDASE